MGAQGLKGEVKAKTFTASPDALPRYGKLHARDGRTFTITAFRPSKQGEAVIAFAEVKDRNTAESLKSTELFVSRDALPEPDEDEFYHADLVGLEARDSEGRVIGKVVAVHNFGAGDLLEVAREGAASVMVPFTEAVVPVVDLASGKLVIEPPDGLFDEGPVEGEEPPTADAPDDDGAEAGKP